MGIFSNKKEITNLVKEKKHEQAAEEANSNSIIKQEDWLNSKWRPAMGWMYMIVCVFDFVVFPIMFTVVQFWETQAANDAFRQWQPLTLAGAGLFHMAMGAVLGLSAWGRTQEKLNGANNGGLQPVSYNATTTFDTFNSNRFDVNNFRTSTPSQNTSGFGQVTTGFGGRPAPIEPSREWI